MNWKGTPLEFSLRGLRILSYHLLQDGDFWSIANRFDPDDKVANEKGRLWILALFLVSCFVLLALGPPALRLAVALLLGAPIWIYAIVEIPERTLGGRLYFSSAGIGLVVGYLSTLGYGWIGCIALVIAFGVRTSVRSFRMRNVLMFWETALLESPCKPRAQLNYAAYLRTARGSVPEVEQILRVVVDAGESVDNKKTSEWQKACANLARVVSERGNYKEGEEIAGRGIERTPGQPDCRVIRGVARMHLDRHEDALTDFKVALTSRYCPTRENVLALTAISAYECDRENDFLDAMDALVNQKGPQWAATSTTDMNDLWEAPRWKVYTELKREPVCTA